MLHAFKLAPRAAVFAPPRTGITRQCDRNKADRSQHSHGQNDPKPVVIHRHPPALSTHAAIPFEAISQASPASARVDQTQDENSRENRMGRAPPATRDARKMLLHCKRFLAERWNRLRWQ